MSDLRRSFWVGKEEISSKQLHFDLLSGIRGLIAELKSVLDPRHVEEHQDDVADADLDR